MRTLALLASLLVSACSQPQHDTLASASPSTSGPTLPSSPEPAVSAGAAASATVAGDAPPSEADPSAEPPGSDLVLAAYLHADAVVVATVRSAELTVLERMPPIYAHALEVGIDRRLSGASLPVQIRVDWSADPLGPFPVVDQKLTAGQELVIALSRVEGSLPTPSVRYVARVVERLSPAREAQLSATLRPAVDGLQLQVAQVAGSHTLAPYGDGVFELTLTNQSKSSVEVPGVWSRDGQALLEQALVVRDEFGRSLRLQRSSARPDDAAPLTLAPGATSKLTVDVRAFGMVRAAGGERRHYSFELGPVRTSSWFYYMSDLHGGVPKAR